MGHPAPGHVWTTLDVKSHVKGRAPSVVVTAI
jgi:hypothetical protein